MLWQAHLSFVLMSFALLGVLRFTSRWRPWLLPVLALCSFIPVNDLPLAAYVRSLTDDLAISTLVLLGWVGLRHLGVARPLSPLHRGQLLLVFAAFALMLYPATMGLTSLDPYRWGFNPRLMIVLIGLVAWALLWRRNLLTVCMLAAGTLAFALRLKASENYWDYLVDPLLAGYCLIAALIWLVKGAAHKLRRAQAV